MLASNSFDYDPASGTVAALMISGCISASSAEAARVHFFRGSGFWGYGVRASVYVDEALIAKMPGNTVAVLRLAPGFHVFRGANKMMKRARKNMRRN